MVGVIWHSFLQGQCSLVVSTNLLVVVILELGLASDVENFKKSIAEEAAFLYNKFADTHT